MVVAATLLVLFLTVSSGNPERRAKRITYGQPLPSLGIYNLYHYVAIRRTWACTTDQTDHSDLTQCQNDNHLCGGTLIHPEFVLTAAHCLMYFDVVVYDKDRDPHDPLWIKDTLDVFTKKLPDYLKKISYAAISYIIKTKPRHTVYSEYALFMGSTNWNTMKYKRHVTKVFPHRKFPKVLDKSNGIDVDKTADTWHDVAVLQTCEPFKIKSGELEIAPMLNTVDDLKTDYARIIKLGLVCLYAGFGIDKQRSSNSTGGSTFRDNIMQHTWRASVCSSNCDNQVGDRVGEKHTCILCSKPLGPKLGAPSSGDSGGPVTCEGKFSATLLAALSEPSRNRTLAESYPFHCVKHAVVEEFLDIYKTTAWEKKMGINEYGEEIANENYHPLRGTRFLRWPLPPE